MSASTNVLSIACSRSGLAAASCSSTNRVRSILGLAAIASLLVSSSSQELVEDHAVAVSPHDATPVVAVVVHHIPGRQPGPPECSLAARDRDGSECRLARRDV